MNFENWLDHIPNEIKDDNVWTRNVKQRTGILKADLFLE